MQKLKRISRVDIQVSILTAILVIASVTCVFLFNYTVSYHDMIEGLNQRTEAIYEFVDGELDKSTFHEINSPEDQHRESYQNMKLELERARAATGVRYLYTAKRGEDGRLIYIADGLPEESADFRNAGDPIEKEIIPDMERALDNQVVLPDDIKKTNWGYIFISYYPIHENGQVVGVLGIEFDAQRQYLTYRKMRVVTPLIALAACLAAMLLAVNQFKRISNPHFQDLANTDRLTGLKNRNAFELDLNNIKNLGQQNGITVIAGDLDDLKQVNDTMGHRAGDRYIQEAAVALENAAGDRGILYRVGGDEFVILLRDKRLESVQEVILTIAKTLQETPRQAATPLSMSIGYASFDPDQDEDLLQTYARADQRMYERKKERKDARSSGI